MSENGARSILFKNRCKDETRMSENGARSILLCHVTGIEKLYYVIYITK